MDLCKLHSNPYKSPVRELFAIISRGRNAGSAQIVRFLLKVKQQGVYLTVPLHCSESDFATRMAYMPSLICFMCPLESDMAAFMKKKKKRKKSHSIYQAFIVMHINQVQGKK